MGKEDLLKGYSNPKRKLGVITFYNLPKDSYIVLYSVEPFKIVVIAFDEEERILVVSFLPKSLSRVLWTSAAGIDRDARRFQRLGAILDWLTGTYSLDLMCLMFSWPR